MKKPPYFWNLTRRDPIKWKVDASVYLANQARWQNKPNLETEAERKIREFLERGE